MSNMQPFSFSHNDRDHVKVTDIIEHRSCLIKIFLQTLQSYRKDKYNEWISGNIFMFPARIRTCPSLFHLDTIKTEA